MKFATMSIPSVVNIRKAQLKSRGYRDLEHWLEDDNHLYVGRNMSFYVPGAIKSKWHNPYTVKKYGLKECLRLYREHITNSPLYDEIHELDGKVLGCWCHPNACHADVLRDIYSKMYGETVLEDDQ